MRFSNATIFHCSFPSPSLSVQEMDRSSRIRLISQQPLRDSSLDHRQNKAGNNTYSEGPCLKRRHSGSTKDIPNSNARRATLGRTKVIVEGASHHQIETSLVSGSFQTKSRRSQRASSKDERKKTQTKSISQDLKKATAATGDSRYRVASTASLSQNDSQQQPLYHTLCPESHYGGTLKRKTILDEGRLKLSSGNRGAPIHGWRSSSIPSSSDSSTFCETSLVSSTSTYAPVFSPKRRRLSLSREEGQSSTYMPMAASSFSSLQYVPMNSLRSLRSSTSRLYSSQISSNITDGDSGGMKSRIEKDSDAGITSGSKKQIKKGNHNDAVHRGRLISKC